MLSAEDRETIRYLISQLGWREDLLNQVKNSEHITQLQEIARQHRGGKIRLTKAMNLVHDVLDQYE